MQGAFIIFSFDLTVEFAEPAGFFGGRTIKGLVIAGTHSGVGKTTVALGLMAALCRRGLSVAPFKVGPDFIDPGHHAQVTGTVSRNLDGWMLSREYNRACFARHARKADVAVVEGVMGLFDGFSGRSEEGSTAQMAKWLGLPVLLVVNAASMARSAAALLQGFERFDADVTFAGALFNHLASESHLAYLEAAMAEYVEMPLLGGILREERWVMPERHLGLMTAEELVLSEDDCARLADCIEDAIDLDGLLAVLPEIEAAPEGKVDGCRQRSSAVRIGVARDSAFCFYYADNLDLLAGAGAEVVPFSPLIDNGLPERLDGIYLGGGYPELHGGQLAANDAMRRSIRACSRAGMPIYAECGGFMYLCRALEDREGDVHSMCGVFPFRTRMNARLRGLGYREVRLGDATVIGGKDEVVRGHEFHYSDLVSTEPSEKISTAYTVTGSRGVTAKAEGYQVQRTLGSYVHLHFGSRPVCATAFVGACRAYRQQFK